MNTSWMTICLWSSTILMHCNNMVLHDEWCHEFNFIANWAVYIIGAFMARYVTVSAKTWLICLHVGTWLKMFIMDQQTTQGPVIIVEEITKSCLRLLHHRQALMTCTLLSLQRCYPFHQQVMVYRMLPFDSIKMSVYMYIVACIIL